MRTFLSLSLLLLYFPNLVLAISGQGTTSASFLKFGFGPRAIAMGEAFTGVADDVSSIYWNPAGLEQLDRTELTAMHTLWNAIFIDHLAVNLPYLNGSLGISLVYLNLSDFPLSDEQASLDDTNNKKFSAFNLGASLAYGFSFTDDLALGASIKLFTENIYQKANIGAAIDIGLLYKLAWNGISLGAVLQNLGPPPTSMDKEYFRLPLNIKLGLAYYPLPNFLLTLDYNQLLEQSGSLALGFEHNFQNFLSLRLGYKFQEKFDNHEVYTNEKNNFIAGLSGGLGVYYEKFSVDYACVPYGFLSNSHRIAITYFF